MKRDFFRGAACVAVSGLFAGPTASAHVMLENPKAASNAGYKAVLQVMHGCKGAPTTSLEVTIPEGIIGVKPMPKPGWTLQMTKGPYAKAYSLEHGTQSEGVKTITWSGGNLPNEEFDEFVFSAFVTDAFAPGASVYFPTVQTCANGVNRWVEVPQQGQSPHALKEPAPDLQIAQTEAAMPAAAVVKAAGLEITAAWLRATPGGAKVAGGYVRIKNIGSEPDRLIGASIPLAGRGEVHEMTMQDGVMRMRGLDQGLEIAPGQSVELKPSGNHLMFLDLTGGLKQGDRIKGTLTFAKAGTVPVEFSVGGIAATTSPEAGMDMQGMHMQ